MDFFIERILKKKLVVMKTVLIIWYALTASSLNTKININKELT